MSTEVTGGRARSNLARDYDRLRKRSQRQYDWYRRAFRANLVPFAALASVGNTHKAYVAGVRDALNAVDARYARIRDAE